MFEQMNSQFLAMTKTFADAAFKANSLALEGFERMTHLQLKTLENRMNATVEFMTHASEVRDFDSAKTMWPKGVQLMKDSAEKMYMTGQEMMGLSLKTTEAMSDLAKGSFEAANDTFNKQVNMVKKTATAGK